MQWYLGAFSKYAVFQGRARRSEYWFFMLFYIIGLFVVSLVDVMLGTFPDSASIGILGSIFAIGHFLPAISLQVRRLHDTGSSGWWSLLVLIPFIGSLVLFFFMVSEGEYQANYWGANPKAA